MLATPVSITYDSVAYSFERVNQDNYSAEYMSTTVPTGISAMRMSVKHTIPKRGSTGESHSVKLDIDYVDTEGDYSHTESVWVNAKTFSGLQDTATLQKTLDALIGLVPSIDSKVLGRES
jgi:hypothetical protein